MVPGAGSDGSQLLDAAPVEAARAVLAVARPRALGLAGARLVRGVAEVVHATDGELEVVRAAGLARVRIGVVTGHAAGPVHAGRGAAAIPVAGAHRRRPEVRVAEPVCSAIGRRARARPRPSARSEASAPDAACVCVAVCGRRALVRARPAVPALARCPRAAAARGAAVACAGAARVEADLTRRALVGELTHLSWRPAHAAQADPGRAAVRVHDARAGAGHAHAAEVAQAGVGAARRAPAVATRARARARRCADALGTSLTRRTVAVNLAARRLPDALPPSRVAVLPGRAVAVAGASDALTPGGGHADATRAAYGASRAVAVGGARDGAHCVRVVPDGAAREAGSEEDGKER